VNVENCLELLSYSFKLGNADVHHQARVFFTLNAKQFSNQIDSILNLQPAIQKDLWEIVLK